MKREQTGVAVVGAGIIGLAHAYIAAKAGRRVCVFERGPSACGASIRNFGMIWPIGQPPGEMHDLAVRSREIWLELLNDARLPFLPTGSLHAAYAPDEADVGREFADLAKPLGYDCDWLNPAQTMAKTAAIRSEGLIGALWSATELTVDPRQVISQLPAFLQERFGVQFCFDSPVREVTSAYLETNGCRYQAEAIVMAGGDDFQTLLPELFEQAGLTRCKLQMMRTVAQPEAWALGPSLAFGLTFRHYPAFEICTSLPALKVRIHAETPEFDHWGIHVMASETATRQITLGDSHQYGLAVDVFDRSDISDLIFNYARSFLRVPDLRIAETWHGVYAKHPNKAFLRMRPADNIRVVVVTSGIGMTLSFALAEQTMRELGAA